VQPTPARHGTFNYVAGFRIGRGRDPRDTQPQQQATGPYGQPDAWQQGGHGEPEYFNGQSGPAPYADNPGHTRQFRFGEEPGAGPGPHPDYGNQDYTNDATYSTGRAAPPTGPKPHWKQLLSGIVLRPNATFWQVRDHAVWGPAIIVTFLYGLLAVFGLEEAREAVLGSTLSNAVPYVLSTGIAVVLSGLVLGSVTHALARQLGGDGAWGPTVGLAMLIMSITDAPRLLFALFLGGNASFVQILGWATWVAAGALFASMVSRSHDLSWTRALGASSIQLIALLLLIKLGTL
jgi:Yip1 domain